MNKFKKQSKGLDISGLSFKSAFKATMGFYLAQAVATALGLFVLIGVAFLIKWLVF